MRNDDNTFTAAEEAWLQEQAAHDPQPRGKSRWQHYSSGRRDRQRREWLRQNDFLRKNLNDAAKAESSPIPKTTPEPDIPPKPKPGFLF